MADAPNPSRSRRQSEICSQCRNRKVRCDSTPGGCDNCRRLGFDCSLSSPSSSSATRPAPSQLRLDRLRAAKACVACHEKKAKCQGGTHPCDRCRMYVIECRYPQSRRARAPKGRRGPPAEIGDATASARLPVSPAGPISHFPAFTSTVPVDPNTEHRLCSPRYLAPLRLMLVSTVWFTSHILISSTDIPKDTARICIEAFFEYVYPIPGLCFIHRGTLMQTFLDGTLNSKLLLAICGVASRFTARVLPCFAAAGDGPKWLEAAEKQILQSPHLLRTDVAALALIAFDHGLSRRFSRLMGVLAFAIRMAYVMRLNHEDKDISFEGQEWRRRIMWGLWMMETTSCDDWPNLSFCRTESIHLQLPCNERSFNINVPVDVGSLRQQTQDPGKDGYGLATYLVRIHDIRRRVTEWTHSFQSPAQTSTVVQLENSIRDFEQELESFHRLLPENHVMNRRNLSRRIYLPSRTTFVMLHIWWHETYINLYCETLNKIDEEETWPVSDPPATRPIEYYRSRYLQHAVAMSTIFSTILSSDNTVCISDPLLADCAWSAVKAITLTKPPALDGHKAFNPVPHLQSCADILMNSAQFYPTTMMVRERIIDILSNMEQILDHPQLARSKFTHECFLRNEITRLSFPPEDPDLLPKDGQGNRFLEDNQCCSASVFSDQMNDIHGQQSHDGSSVPEALGVIVAARNEDGSDTQPESTAWSFQGLDCRVLEELELDMDMFHQQ